MAGEVGFEPTPADPESAVLPLDDSPAYLKLYHVVISATIRDNLRLFTNAYFSH